MSQPKDRLKKKSTGQFFVDSSCIDCGSCWQIDPDHFAANGKTSYVHTQPNGPQEIKKALLALIDCPVAAISAPKNLIANLATNVFPILVTKYSAGDVYYCGWSSHRSFGASSWLIVRPEGNVLIDSPRWSDPLSKQIKKMGGIKHIVLTHRDDVADHAYWAKAFNCARWIHQDDSDAAPDAENKVIGQDILPLSKSLKLIPTPGHTKGSLVAVLGNKKQILFSGDHLWWDAKKAVIVASKTYCWWNWNAQLKSIQRLIDLDIGWLLPGHGYAHQFMPGQWKEALTQTLNYSGKTVNHQ